MQTITQLVYKKKGKEVAVQTFRAIETELVDEAFAELLLDKMEQANAHRAVYINTEGVKVFISKDEVEKFLKGDEPEAEKQHVVTDNALEKFWTLWKRLKNDPYATPNAIKERRDWLKIHAAAAIRQGEIKAGDKFFDFVEKISNGN